MSEDSDYTSDVNYPMQHQHNHSAHQLPRDTHPAHSYRAAHSGVTETNNGAIYNSQYDYCQTGSRRSSDQYDGYASYSTRGGGYNNSYNQYDHYNSRDRMDSYDYDRGYDHSYDKNDQYDSHDTRSRYKRRVDNSYKDYYRNVCYRDSGSTKGSTHSNSSSTRQSSYALNKHGRKDRYIHSQQESAERSFDRTNSFDRDGSIKGSDVSNRYGEYDMVDSFDNEQYSSQYGRSYEDWSNQQTGDYKQRCDQSYKSSQVSGNQHDQNGFQYDQHACQKVQGNYQHDQQDQHEYQQDQQGYQQDQHEYHQGQHEYQRDQHEYQQDQHDNHQDQHEYQQDQHGYQQDQHEYHQDQYEYQRDEHEYQQDKHGYHQDQQSYQQGHQSHSHEQETSQQMKPGYKQRQLGDQQDQQIYFQDQQNQHTHTQLQQKYETYDNSYQQSQHPSTLLQCSSTFQQQTDNTVQVSNTYHQDTSLFSKEISASESSHREDSIDQGLDHQRGCDKSFDSDTPVYDSRPGFDHNFDQSCGYNIDQSFLQNQVVDESTGLTRYGTGGEGAYDESGAADSFDYSVSMDQPDVYDRSVETSTVANASSMGVDQTGIQAIPDGDTGNYFDCGFNDSYIEVENNASDQPDSSQQTYCGPVEYYGYPDYTGSKADTTAVSTSIPNQMGVAHAHNGYCSENALNEPDSEPLYYNSRPSNGLSISADLDSCYTNTNNR